MTTSEPARALIVEDDPVVARSIARRLLREGYTVSLAQSCKAARDAGKGFRVAVLDLDLPDGSGTDLADYLLSHEAVQSIVFYTGSIDHHQRERATRLGSLIDKSSDLEDVVSALEPFPTAPPISQMAPAPRAWARASGSRLTRVLSDEESVVDVASRSSRR
jgi:ActR/RegA family two-component response regulator